MSTARTRELELIRAARLPWSARLARRKIFERIAALPRGRLVIEDAEGTWRFGNAGEREELVAHVMVRLQPRLEAWVEAQVRRALMEMLPVWAESASLAIVRDLRSEMPELLSIALDEVHRQRHG